MQALPAPRQQGLGGVTLPPRVLDTRRRAEYSRTIRGDLGGMRGKAWGAPPSASHHKIIVKSFANHHVSL
jgi:hypothetical protein